MFVIIAADYQFSKKGENQSIHFHLKFCPVSFLLVEISPNQKIFWRYYFIPKSSKWDYRETKGGVGIVIIKLFSQS
jgi:hypothetical protein